MILLQHLLEASAQRCPEKVAVEDPGRGQVITYRALNELSDRVRDDLLHRGVGISDRVGICAGKSIAGLISVFGILKAGAAYVPAPADAPISRTCEILSDCSARAMLVEKGVLERIRAEPGEGELEVAGTPEALASYGDGLALATRRGGEGPAAADRGAPEGLAYILYTSGSTGRPKGVMHSHGSALSFVDWCSEAFEPTGDDRFSSHAPFHFDLSIFDIYVAIKHGATLVLIGEDAGKQPTHLAELIDKQRISIWYSTPSTLRLLAEYGRIDRHDHSHLRLVLFAGEVFPRRHLRSLLEQWPARRYYNLYGPTETNVCTFHEIAGPGSLDGIEPSLIGKACAGMLTRVMDENGSEVRRGEAGELHVSGGTVMLGYWDRPGLNAEAFIVDGEGRRWYRTGDVVKEAETGSYLFLGRRDRMVKRRGYRIELGEIESLLYRNPLVNEAAAIALTDRDGDVRIKAFIRWAGKRLPSLIEFKLFCGKNMPSHLIPDQVSFMPMIPKTSTGKVDYQALACAD